MKCVITAGGKGTRLWPLSRRNKPKQFQCLVSEKTMLQETFLWARKKFDIKDIYVSTNQEYVSEVEKEILELPKENIISEPEARGLASSIALTLAVISARTKKDESLVFFTADHLIKNPEMLLEAVEESDKFLEENPSRLITYGINPSAPETGFGYIQKGDIIKGGANSSFLEVSRFVEKPDLMAAQKYLDSGEYLWSSGIYCFKTDAVIEKFKKYLPDTHKRLLKIRAAVDSEKYEEALLKEYPQMDKIDFAYSIVENDDQIVVVPLNLDWSDVGSWTSLKDTLINDKKAHFIKGEHLDFESENLLVYGSKKLIATVGLKDLVIVDTEDAILICNRNKSKLVSDVVKHLEETGKIALL